MRDDPHVQTVGAPGAGQQDTMDGSLPDAERRRLLALAAALALAPGAAVAQPSAEWMRLRRVVTAERARRPRRGARRWRARQQLADLIELAFSNTNRERQFTTLLGWLKSLPTSWFG